MSSGSVYDEKSVNALIMKEATHSIRKAFRQWLAKHQRPFLEDLSIRKQTSLEL